MKRASFMLSVALSGGAIGIAAQAAPAQAEMSPAWYVVNDINAFRASHGLAPLAIQVQNLQAAAEAWNANLVRVNALGHNPDLALQAPPGWTVLGENVGVGPSVAAVENGFTQSPEHLANLLDPYYTMVGVSVIRSPDGEVFITEDFAN